MMQLSQSLRPVNYLTNLIEVVSKLQITSKDKAPIRFKSGAYTLVREHFKSNRNAVFGC